MPNSTDQAGGLPVEGRKMLSRRTVLGAAATAAASRTGRTWASPDIVVGVLYPFSGPNAGIGTAARHALETALDVVNEPQPDLDLPLAESAGLPNLGGARLRLVLADHRSDPAVGRAEAERLVSDEHVCALLGSYQSAVAAAISQVAERHSIPYLAADNSAPSLTRRGRQYIFRPGAHDEMYSIAMFDFLDAQKRRGSRVETIALIYEDTIFGTDSSNIQRRLAGERGYVVAADLRYRANTASLAAEVELLKAANADVLMPTSYTRDSILLVKTMAELKYKPRNIVAQDAGFSDRTLYDAVGSTIVGAVTRAAFSPDLIGRRPSVARVNALFKERSGHDLGDLSSREFMALLILADAIDRAGSTDGARIRDALGSTSIPGERTIMPWTAVHFDETGQNRFADPVLLQWTGTHFVTIYPKAAAVEDARWPMNPV